MDQLYTELGDRPDLAAIEVNAPEGYIADKVMPIVNVVDKTGTIYYATVEADAAAQTSRAAGGSVTATQISDSNTTFTTAEYIKRGAVTPTEVKQMGGIEKADMVGAKFAKRQVMGALEEAVAAEVMDGAIDETFDSANATIQIQVANEALRLYEGKTVLVASTKTLKTMINQMAGDSVIGPAFVRLVSGSAPSVAVQGLGFDIWLAGLAMYLGVDEVQAGADTVWGTSARVARFTVMKQSTDMDPLAHKYLPIFGKTYMFLPDTVQPYQIESIPDRILKNNYYDSTIRFDTVALNSAALYQFDGVV